MKTIDIIGTRVAPARFEQVIDELLEAARTGRHLRIHFGTVHSLVEATRDGRLRGAFDSASMVCTDGMPLVWLARLRGARGAERVCGPDVLLALADRGRGQNLRHFLFGGRPGVAGDLAVTLRRRFPGVEIVGEVSPPEREVGELEPDATIDAINASRADVVWIGLGSPKQELWAANHAERLNAKLVLPVGAAFDFHSGRVRRAPRWAQRVGLEWIFRLATEPRRLGGRYLRTNAQFVWLLLSGWRRSGSRS